MTILPLDCNVACAPTQIGPVNDAPVNERNWWLAAHSGIPNYFCICIRICGSSQNKEKIFIEINVGELV